MSLHIHIHKYIPLTRRCRVTSEHLSKQHHTFTYNRQRQQEIETPQRVPHRLAGVLLAKSSNFYFPVPIHQPIPAPL